MDVILNELSLTGQFDNENLFLNNLNEIIMMTHLINQLDNLNLLKSNKIWNSKITDSLTLIMLLQKKGSDILNKIRLDLSKVSSSPPYWEDTQIHSCIKNSYNYNNENICNTGLAESSERNQVIISFQHNLFKNSNINIIKNLTDININNINNLKELSQYLYTKKVLNEYKFCKYFFNTSKLNFSKLDDAKRGFNTLNKKQKKLFINQLKIFAETSWSNIISSDGIEYKKYNNTLKGFTNIDIYKFRINKKYRCFGYRSNDTFYIVHFEINHKLSDIG
ncbi:MAG: hypothetical protein DRG78_20660 [Epsilonproteobacteria bacterium]|nr:MAG: hypothetical protein DRG78_20660 [Campylobacterota bacterium]